MPRKEKPPKFDSSEESEEIKGSDDDSERDDEQIVGFIGEADEYGKFDDAKFVESGAEVKQKRGQNFIRKYHVPIKTR